MFDLIEKQNKAAFYDTIQKLDYSWIVASLFIGFLSHLIRAHRWKYLLEPMGYQTAFSSRYHATMIGYIVNMTIPRAGEASRAGVLGKINEIPFAKAFGTIIAERIVDLIMLALVGLLTILLSFSDFQLLYEKLFISERTDKNSNLVVLVGVASGVILLGAIVLFAIPKLRKKILDFLAEIKSGILSIFQSKNPIHFVLYSVAIWALYLLYFGICFYALEETSGVSVQGVMMSFIAGTIGVMLTNGGVGVYPLFVGTVITFYAFPEENGANNLALALATVIWLFQTLFLIILGLISLAFVSKNFPLQNESNTEKH